MCMHVQAHVTVTKTTAAGHQNSKKQAEGGNTTVWPKSSRARVTWSNGDSSSQASCPGGRQRNVRRRTRTLQTSDNKGERDGAAMACGGGHTKQSPRTGAVSRERSPCCSKVQEESTNRDAPTSEHALQTPTQLILKRKTHFLLGMHVHQQTEELTQWLGL